ncbi:hypothetical protein KOI51_10080 [Escherichia coli]|nr:MULTISPECIES: hypothetical protein [Enterobacteriaceae]EIH9382261.1 hypothetical protein [Escherichia coli]ELL3144957.1 hypothetical protein [Escherichia coli]MBY8741397.1 hypothetical protein [Escherichia coli]MBY8754815.1 hypothetical protein [Escherichia coli]
MIIKTLNMSARKRN